jgi:1-acyl-sn-glycerol-3-phosphate acyltransferase
MIHKQKAKIKRPGLSYILLGSLIWFYAVFIKRQRLYSSLPRGFKPPYIVIGNHTSFYDFVYALRAIYPARVNFVVARKYFHFRGLCWVMKRAKAIPKSLYQSDTSTIMNVLGILKQGGAVGLFPEGQISINGITIENGETIAKLVKKASVPVVRVLTGGAYFSNPPWARSTRRGIVESRVDIILTKDEVSRLSADEIMEIMQKSIYMDSYEWQEKTNSTYRGKKLAAGLEDILYLCPGCGTEYNISTDDNKIECRNCGTEAAYGEDGHLHWKNPAHFKHIGEWLLWQLEQERSKISGSEAFNISHPVELAMLKQRGKGIEIVGKGCFTADRDNYIYEGTQNGKNVRLVFPTTNTRYLPFDTGRNFQIYKNNLLYEFRPENPKWCVKIANICEVLYQSRRENSYE